MVRSASDLGATHVKRHTGISERVPGILRSGQRPNSRTHPKYACSWRSVLSSLRLPRGSDKSYHEVWKSQAKTEGIRGQNLGNKWGLKTLFATEFRL